jgi:hypothetical protein
VYDTQSSQKHMWVASSRACVHAFTHVCMPQRVLKLVIFIVNFDKAIVILLNSINGNHVASMAVERPILIINMRGLLELVCL